MVKAGWQRPFDDPILLPGGGKLLTLRDAGNYIAALPRAEAEREAWQTAIHCLIGAVEGRDFLMHARIGMIRALNGHNAKKTPVPPWTLAKAYRVIR
jgi:hypothetical protein